MVLGEKLGHGSHGEVYKGYWGVREVAAKKFHLSTEEASQGPVQREIDMLKRLSFRHIIQFYGTMDHNGALVIITDLAECGSLKHAILNNVIPAKDWKTNARLAKEIALGLAYIHSEEILHLDLKSDNVLLSRHMEVKLCDFGLAQVKATISSKSLEIPRGTVRWMAPELFRRKPLYSYKSDVYSLGMVMWELATHSTLPFKEHNENLTVSHLIANGERESLPDDTPPVYRSWVERFWDLTPENRPDAIEMVKKGLDEEETNGGPKPEVPQESAPVTTAARRIVEMDKTMVQEMDILSRSEDGSSGGVSGSVNSGRTLPIRKDEEKEFLRYLRQAMKGHVKAQNVVGLKFYYGRGVLQSDDEAFRWMTRAAKSGEAFAQTNLGSMFLNGRGVIQNDYTAVEWFEKSAKQGCAAGQRSLAMMLIAGRGVIRDERRAAKLLQEAAEQDDIEAAYQLGLLYDKGQGVSQCHVQAFEWFSRAAASNHVRAQNAVGWAYCFGQGVEQNDEQAVDWYSKSAAQHYKHALFNLAVMYELGLGVKRNEKEAMAHYRKAAHRKVADAILHIRWLFHPDRRGKLPKSDAEMSDLYFEEAKKGHAAAQFSLGVLLEKGRYLRENRELAFKWYGLAAGQSHACATLRQGALQPS
ncbi:hypothetical protein BGZ73_004221 [Actinomortierella ambigua]|nr:hypothetical protein BGZ73_004221 [Actinomortierella ambigua]